MTTKNINYQSNNGSNNNNNKPLISDDYDNGLPIQGGQSILTPQYAYHIYDQIVPYMISSNSTANNVNNSQSINDTNNTATTNNTLYDHIYHQMPGYSLSSTLNNYDAILQPNLMQHQHPSMNMGPSSFKSSSASSSSAASANTTTTTTSGNSSNGGQCNQSTNQLLQLHQHHQTNQHHLQHHLQQMNNQSSYNLAHHINGALTTVPCRDRHCTLNLAATNFNTSGGNRRHIQHQHSYNHTLHAMQQQQHQLLAQTSNNNSHHLHNNVIVNHHNHQQNTKISPSSKVLSKISSLFAPSINGMIGLRNNLSNLASNSNTNSPKKTTQLSQHFQSNQKTSPLHLQTQLSPMPLLGGVNGQQTTTTTSTSASSHSKFHPQKSPNHHLFQHPADIMNVNPHSCRDDASDLSINYDLIIIKQQQHERKQQRKRIRNNLIFWALVTTILISVIGITIRAIFMDNQAPTTQNSNLDQLYSNANTDLTWQIQPDPNNDPNNQFPKSGPYPPTRGNSAPSTGPKPRPNIMYPSMPWPPLRQPELDLSQAGSNNQVPDITSQQNPIYVSNVDPQIRGPTDCSGHGVSIRGVCKCDVGYKGLECHQKISECSSSNCNNNGQCIDGQCQCYAGFIGDQCADRDCNDKKCSNNGFCSPITGQCQCNLGYKGVSCELRDNEIFPRLLNCSNHGQFNLNEKRCICDHGFIGFDCSEEKCDASVDCGQNGIYNCQSGKCTCNDGYYGDRCELQLCSSQCSHHGHCVNGTCVCQQGFYGKHCTIDGCPNDCSGRGECIRKSPLSQEWHCHCQPGSTSDDCSLLLEQTCDDNVDNDEDGLIDCADSECCSERVCQNSTFCLKSANPMDILMRKQPPPPTSSFFQRMQFLIDKDSSQSYASFKDFTDSAISKHLVADRASVIRGRVVHSKQGIIGVRVSIVQQVSLGITLTREGGWFDIMVNGGGAVTLEFRREPFLTVEKTIAAPWNEIVLIDPIELQLEAASKDVKPQKAPSIPDNPICPEHNNELMKPNVLTAPRASAKHIVPSLKSSTTSPKSSSSAILQNSRTVQQSIILPGTSAPGSNQQPILLLYNSKRANEFMSTIDLHLTPTEQEMKLPENLKAVHLKITIEGNLFEQVLEPQSNLTFTYAWNRRNVYKQKSFGLSVARVSVGYEYFNCQQVMWTMKQVQLPGHDMLISDIGSHWNLNIHHRYNYHDAILHRGDGQNFYLKHDKPLWSGQSNVPVINKQGEYEIPSPDNSDELLIFNRNGLHVATRDISVSGTTSTSATVLNSAHQQLDSNGHKNKYTFTYDVNTSFGRLSSVIDSTGNKIYILRDGHHNVKTIDTTLGGKCQLEITKNGLLLSIVTNNLRQQSSVQNETKFTFGYYTDGGLLKQSYDVNSGDTYEFSYDDFGRAQSITFKDKKSSTVSECPISTGMLTSNYSRITNTINSANSKQFDCHELVLDEF